jgi:hypothetical protein
VEHHGSVQPAHIERAVTLFKSVSTRCASVKGVASPRVLNVVAEGGGVIVEDVGAGYLVTVTKPDANASLINVSRVYAADTLRERFANRS